MQGTGVWRSALPDSPDETGPVAGMWQDLKADLDFSRYVPEPRPGVVARELQSKDETYYVLKSPTGHYLRMNPASYFLWSQMDGHKSIKDILVAYFFKFHAFAFDHVKNLVVSLREKGFLEPPPSHIYGQLMSQIHRDQLGSWGSRILASFVQREFAIRGLDGGLSWMYERFVQYLYRKPALLLYTLISVIGMVLFGITVNQGQYSFLTTNSSLLQGVVWLYLALFFTIVLHEAAHAFTVKYFGREVRRGGVMIYIGSLAFFVDTMDIWLEGRKARIAVSWAGPFMDLIVGSIMSGIIFLFPDFPLNDLLFKVASITYISVLLNLNPLIELDGYFILMDWLEIPSLRKRSLSFLREKLVDKLKSREKFSTEERVFLVFGVLAAVYTTFALTMAAFLVQQRVWPLVSSLWNRPGFLGKLLVGAVALVALVLIGYVVLSRVFRLLQRFYRWLLVKGVFANKRNVALLVLLPAVVLHVIAWANGQAMWLAELSRPLILVWGLVTIGLVLAHQDISLLRRAIVALALPLALLLAAETVDLLQRLGGVTLSAQAATALRAAAIASLLVVAYLSFAADNLKLASRWERGAVVGLLLVATVAAAGAAVWLLTGSAPLIVAIAVGAALGLAALALAIMTPQLGGFWRSSLRYVWLYLMLAAPGLSLGALWLAAPAARGEMGVGLSLALALSYSALTGACVLYYLIHTQTYDQLRPLEAELNLSVREELTRAAQHLTESMLARYQALYGERQLQTVQNAINTTSASARWGVTISRGRLLPPDNVSQIEPSLLAMRYQQLIDYVVQLLQRGAGQGFTKRTMQRAYDSLTWEGREILSEYVLQGSEWGGWLSRQFKETRRDYQALLSRIPLFYHCDAAELDEICARLKVRIYPAGTEIIRQGDVGDAFYIVQSGKVTVWQKNEDGWERLVNEHTRGGTFGEAALLHDAPRNATCLAAIPTTVLILERQDFQLIRHHFEVKEKFSQHIDYTHQLQDIPLFRETPIEQLKEIAARLTPQEVETGQVFVRQGEIGDKFYIIEAGEVEIFTVDDGGAEKVIARRGPGEYVGEIALLLDVPRTASIRALTPLKLLALAQEEFLSLVERQEEIRLHVDRVSTRRLYGMRTRGDMDETPA